MYVQDGSHYVDGPSEEITRGFEYKVKKEGKEGTFILPVEGGLGPRMVQTLYETSSRIHL